MIQTATYTLLGRELCAAIRDGIQKPYFIAVVIYFGCFFFGFTRLAYGDEKYLAHDPAKGPLPAFSKIYDTVENSALVKLKYEDTERITIRQVTLFHRKVIDRCITMLPNNVELQYNGPLGESRQKKFRIVGDDGVMRSLSWDVLRPKGSVIFGFWISTERTNTSMFDIDIDKRNLFINVSFIDENQSVDKKLPQLGNKSVREVLGFLKPKKEKNGKPKPLNTKPKPMN